MRDADCAAAIPVSAAASLVDRRFDPVLAGVLDSATFRERISCAYGDTHTTC